MIKTLIIGFLLCVATVVAIEEDIICGNGVCEAEENCSCLEDCPCAEGYSCQDYLCKPLESKKFPLKLVTMGMLILATLAMIIWLVCSLKKS